MGKRRANGEGSIFKRKDGLWAAQYTDNTGKKRVLYGKTQQIAKDKLKEAIRQSDKGLLMDKNNITLVEWINEWLEVYARPTIKKTTYASYYRLLNNHVIPYFPKVLLKDLRTDMLQKHFNMLAREGSKRRIKDPNTGKLIPSKQGLSHETRRKIIVLLMMVIGKAVDTGIIARNVAANVKLEQEQPKERRILTIEEQRRLECVLLRDEKPLCFPIYLYLYTGLRIGELMGIRESDFDYNRKELHISQIVTRVEVPGSNSTEIVIGSPKTYTSRRTIPLPSFVADGLQRFIDSRKEQRELLRLILTENGESEKVKLIDEGYLFISTNGNICDAVSLRNTLEWALKEANVPHINFHALRHTFATRCSESGFDAKTLAEILGHADTNITFNTYIHTTEEQKRMNMDKLKPISETPAEQE